MRPENQVLLFAWINAILEHAEMLLPQERKAFVEEELRKLEIDFLVVLIWENEQVILSIPF